jgi:hypothetical protein
MLPAYSARMVFGQEPLFRRLYAEFSTCSLAAKAKGCHPSKRGEPLDAGAPAPGACGQGKAATSRTENFFNSTAT